VAGLEGHGQDAFIKSLSGSGDDHRQRAQLDPASVDRPELLEYAAIGQHRLHEREASAGESSEPTRPSPDGC
jgi:hypothetical protein